MQFCTGKLDLESRWAKYQWLTNLNADHNLKAMKCLLFTTRCSDSCTAHASDLFSPQSLQHNIRYERLLYKEPMGRFLMMDRLLSAGFPLRFGSSCWSQVRDRWHEDLVGDRLQLKISHNPLVRSDAQGPRGPGGSQAEASAVRSRSQRYRPTSVSSSLQLKDFNSATRSLNIFGNEESI